MQATLLGAGIALILALLAAVFGPLFVDWSAYRATFETRASAWLGAPVRLAGKIDVRLLPTPSLTLAGVEIGERGYPSLKVRQLGVELALGPLLKGDWRATELRLAGAEARLVVDGDGRFAQAPFRLSDETLAVDRFALSESRIVLAFPDGAVALDGVSFTGDLRSLLGPVKGDGEFAIGADRYGFRLTAGKYANDEMRLRLTLDGDNRLLNADAEGVLRLHDGAPRFEGAVTLARSAGVALASGRALSTEPWRITAKVKAAPTAVVAEQLELSYGPGERAIKLLGAAELGLGAAPQLAAVLSARLLDIDRFGEGSASGAHGPGSTLAAFAQKLRVHLSPTLPVRLGVSVDSLMLGGALLQGLRADLSFLEDAVDVESFELKAPGNTRVGASGRVSISALPVFSGPIAIASGDPRAFAAWAGVPLSEVSPGSASIAGDLTLGSDRIALDALQVELNQQRISGRVAYAWSAVSGRPNITAELKAADLDLDALAAYARVPESLLRWGQMPDAQLSVLLDRATVAGMPAQNVAANVTLANGSLAIEQLAIGSLAGDRIAVSGQIQDLLALPRGALVIELAGERLQGASTLLEKLHPAAVDYLRPLLTASGPARLKGSASFDASPSPASPYGWANLKLDGLVGPLTLGASGTLKGDLVNWRQADVTFEGRVESSDGRAVARLIRLDDLAGVLPGPGALAASIAGRFDGVLKGHAGLTVQGLRADASVALSFNTGGFTANGAASLEAADMVALRAPLGRLDKAAPAKLVTRFTITPEQVRLSELTGDVAGSKLAGDLVVGGGAGMRHVEGRLSLDFLDARPVLAWLAGAPSSSAAVANGRPPVWSPDPFATTSPARLDGGISLRVASATVAPGLALTDATGRLRFGRDEVALEGVEGTLAGGRAGGEFTMTRSADGLTADARLTLVDVDLAAVFAASALPRGRASIRLQARGSGRTPAALVGSLSGAGAVTVERAEVVGLNPRAFELAAEAVDAGAPASPERISAIVGAALDQGRIRFARADATLAITAGQVQMASPMINGEGANLAVQVGIDAVQGQVDARVSLTGRSTPDGPAVGRPEVYVSYKGPIWAPTRRVDVSALVGWLTLRAVEQQARKLEVLERERAEVEAARAARTAPRSDAGSAAVEPAAAPTLPPPPVLMPSHLGLMTLPPLNAEGGHAVLPGFVLTPPSSLLAPRSEGGPLVPAQPTPPAASISTKPATSSSKSAPVGPSTHPLPAAKRPTAVPALPAPIEIRPLPSRGSAVRSLRKRHAANGKERFGPARTRPLDLAAAAR